ncbi:hypothetical protein BVY04_02215 [bacterium M21]|nr:hypothetical protein BVY04_02215 [bacterium M21]
MSPRKRTLRRCLQVANLLALLLLLLLYLLHCVEKQSGPVYRTVKETPVERFALRLLPRLWRHRSFLERQAMQGSLNSTERMQTKILLQRMELIRPTHAVRLTTGEFLFGKLKHHGDKKFELTEYDGAVIRKRPINRQEIGERKPLTPPAFPFDERDLRFLLSHEMANHFDLHPYLFAADTNYAAALETFAGLSILHDDFCSTFAPLINPAHEEVKVHVRLFDSPQIFMQQATAFESSRLINADAFFHKPDNTFYLLRPPPTCKQKRQGKPGQHLTNARHEGTHHLAQALGLWKGFAQSPFWLDEGLAQYCETQPFGDDQPEKYALLRTATKEGKRIPLELLVALPNEAADRLPAWKLELAYAESWLLVRYLMAPERRLRFFSYLLQQANETDEEIGPDPSLSLVNGLKTTHAKLAANLAAELASRPSQTP